MSILYHEEQKQIQCFQELNKIFTQFEIIKFTLFSCTYHLPTSSTSSSLLLKCLMKL